MKDFGSYQPWLQRAALDVLLAQLRLAEQDRRERNRDEDTVEQFLRRPGNTQLQASATLKAYLSAYINDQDPKDLESEQLFGEAWNLLVTSELKYSEASCESFEGDVSCIHNWAQKVYGANRERSDLFVQVLIQAMTRQVLAELGRTEAAE